MAGGFAALALVILFMPEPFRDGLGLAVRSSVLRPVIALQRGAADREGRYADAERLRAERDSLASFLVGQAGLAAENRQLRALLGFRERLTYSFIPAEAARGGEIGSRGTLLLGVGRRDGVRDGAVLVTADGLVGGVHELRQNDAVAIDWTHPEFAVSVMTLDGETYGIAKPMRGPGGERMLAFSPQAFHTAPDTGAMIVTSGDGARYPRGVPVGKVVGAGKAEDGWQRAYYLRPLVSPAQMSHVLVLGEPVKAPTDQDLASAWGIRLADSPRPPDSLAAPVSPDAATPAPGVPEAPRPARPRPARPRFVDPTPELPGRAVDPNAPRVPPGFEPPPQPRRRNPPDLRERRR